MTPINETPSATIILPLLKQHDEWLRQCLLSALNQTANCEVLVVIAADTPRTNIKLLEQLQIQFGGFEVILREPGTEFAAALNLGFHTATTNRIGILLSDDWLAPTAVEACLEHTADIVSTGTVIFSEGSVRDPIFAKRTQDQYERLATMEEKASYIEHFFLFKKNKLLEIGGVDTQIGKTGADDYDMIWSLLEYGASVTLVEQCLYHMRDHEKQRLTLRNLNHCRRELAAIFNKHGVTGEQKSRLLAHHGRWCGRKIFDVVDELEQETG